MDITGEDTDFKLLLELNQDSSINMLVSQDDVLFRPVGENYIVSPLKKSTIEYVEDVYPGDEKAIGKDSSIFSHILLISNLKFHSINSQNI